VKSRLFVGRVLLAMALTTACADSSDPPQECTVTPDATHSVNSSTLIGKRGGAVFFHTNVPERVFTAKLPEKMLVFLDDLSDRGPGQLTVKGKNLKTGTTIEVKNVHHESEYGREWGANYTFPEPGCWQLSVDDVRNKGSITVLVTE
jgi:hypothetical protein